MSTPGEESPTRITWDEFKAGAAVPPAPPVRSLRIGARVRCTAEDDPFIDHGTEGVVVNTMPQRPHSPARARILWDSDQSCLMDATDFEVIPQPIAAQPVVMGPFGRAS